MAPRPKKPRHCCRTLIELGVQIFKPAGTPLVELEKIHILPDELESMRLCDSLGLTQQQAGERMGISRGTVQRLVNSGRKILIETLLEGQALVLDAEELADVEDLPVIEDSEVNEVA